MTTRDFTKDRRTAPTFTIGDNTYTATVGLPAQTMLNFASSFGSLTKDTPVDQQLTAFGEILDVMLEDESAVLFHQSMETKHPRNMIEFDQMEEIITWLLEEFGMRPTQPSLPSVTGPDPQGPGMSSTGNTPAVELI